MQIEYNIGSTTARLKLVAFNGLHGGVIYEGIIWTVKLIHPDPAKAQLLTTPEALPLLNLPEGEYAVSANYLNEDYALGNWYFKVNTLSHLAFIFRQIGDYNSEEGYYAEHDSQIHFQLRGEERSGQAKYGSATTPLISPYIEQQGEISTSLLAHPLLANKAQMDGVPPEVNPTTINTDALRATLELDYQNQPSPSAAPQFTRG